VHLQIQQVDPQKNGLEGIQLDVVGHKQHSGRASGPKSPC
jgi:hypothetical protein